MKTLRRRTLKNGEERSMSLQEDFHASLSASQVEERERMITATSGRTCSALYGKSDPLGLLVKTLLESSRWYSPARRLKWDAKPLFSERITEKEYCFDRNTLSKPFVQTLNEKDIPSNRCLFRLVPSERPTEETGCGLSHDLLPTPRAMEVVEHPMKAAARTKDRTGTRLNNLSSGAAFGLLPTPMAQDHRRRGPNSEQRGLPEMAYGGMLPTPKAQEARGNASIDRGKYNLTDEIAKRYNPGGKSSQLNPLFVEEMMGFPLMWTTLPFLSQDGDRNQSRDMETP